MADDTGVSGGLGGEDGVIKGRVDVVGLQVEGLEGRTWGRKDMGFEFEGVLAAWYKWSCGNDGDDD